MTADQPRDAAIAALAGHPSPDRGSGPWVLRLVCCGYDDGIERYATWDEADMFRQTYVTGPGGHDRAAILTRDLACWCPVGDPCHADVLLELANR